MQSQVIVIQGVEATLHLSSPFALGFLRKHETAFTFGRHIFCKHASMSPSVLRHEIAHAKQYQRYGIVGFLLLYAYYQIVYGYEKNPLEVEARAAE